MSACKNKRQLSIRTIMVLTFTLLMLITVIVNGAIIFSNWRSSAEETTIKIASDLNDEIYHEIDTFISSAMHVNDVNHRLIEEGIVDIKNETQREKFFVGILQSHSEEIYSVSIGTEDGEYYGARRNENGLIEIMRNNESTGGNSWYYTVKDDLTAGEIAVKLGPFDPRSRDWYKAAKELGQPVFSPIYKHFVMDDLTVSAAYPIYKENGDLMGVMGTHIILSNINDYLTNIANEKNGFSLIFEKESDYMIANSYGLDNFIVQQDNSMDRKSIRDIENQAVIEAVNDYNGEGTDEFKKSHEHESVFIRITEYNKDGLNWLIITAIPETFLTSDINDNIRLTSILVVAASLLSIAIYLILTNKLINPLNNLIKATQKMTEGDLSQRAAVYRNDEIGRITGAFNDLAQTLESTVTNLESTVKERTKHLEQSNNALKENKDQLQLLLNSTAEAIYGVNKNGFCTFCNASCIRILGYSDPKDLIGKNMHDQIHHSYRDGKPMPINECKIVKAFIENKGTHVDDEVFWRADGTSFDVEYYSYPQVKNGEVIGAVVTFMDNTERKEAEQKIEYLSSHDSLTDLYNRMRFELELKKINKEENLPITIIFADANGLKLTNDIFGHAAGDELLKQIAVMFKRVCREGDIVARVGGDEFVVLLPKTDDRNAKKIIERIRKGFLQEKNMAITGEISMGKSTKQNIFQDIERVMENAENNMYKEKTLKRKHMSSVMIDRITNTLHEKYPEEKRHSKEVRRLCREIGQAMELSKKEVVQLEQAGYYHDIGKIVIDTEIMNKKGKLSKEEMQELEQHAVVGYRILNIFDETLDLAEVVYSHHERWDGTGYPKGLKGKEIPQLARIISVAESYDRIIHRAYNKKTSDEDAKQILRDCAGTQFDPEIVELFINLGIQ